MIKQMVISLTILILSASWVWGGPPAQVEDGEWEFTIATEVAGMPMKMPPMTYKQCITQSDPVPQNAQPDQHCETKDVSHSGKTISWTIVCQSPNGEMTGKGKATYEKDHMEGSMSMDVQGMTMVNSYKGHRIGPCK